MPSVHDHLDATLKRMNHGRTLKGELLMVNQSRPYVPYAQPLLDAVELFESLDLGYALIGGIAAMYFGRSRFTEDVDFVAASGHTETFATHPAEMEAHHFESDCALKLSHKSGIQVDLWKDDYSDGIIARAIPVQLAGRTVRVIEPHDLIAMKLRAGRLKDDYDISEILKNNQIDRAKVALFATSDQMLHLAEIENRK